MAPTPRTPGQPVGRPCVGRRTRRLHREPEERQFSPNPVQYLNVREGGLLQAGIHREAPIEIVSRRGGGYLRKPWSIRQPSCSRRLSLGNLLPAPFLPFAATWKGHRSLWLARLSRGR